MRIGLYFQADDDLVRKCSRIARLPIELFPENPPEIVVTQGKPELGKNTIIVQTLSAGVDHIDFKEFPENVVLLSNAGAFSKSVAQHALALLLSSSRNIVSFDVETKSGKFTRGPVDSLEGQTAGIIGYGGIGRSFARLVSAVGMKVGIYSRKPDPDSYVKFTFSTLEDLMKSSYVILISVPYTKVTHNIINEKLLSIFSGKYIINVARANIVKEDDMRFFLKNNPDKFYLSDVWWNEPEINMPVPHNVILTPHVAGIRRSSYDPTFMEPEILMAFRNLRKYLDGKPSNIVIKDEYI
ncbi:MAG: 2-hydroxyacid dehydrogenase [Thermoplasmata archaeon]